MVLADMLDDAESRIDHFDQGCIFENLCSDISVKGLASFGIFQFVLNGR